MPIKFWHFVFILLLFSLQVIAQYENFPDIKTGDRIRIQTKSDVIPTTTPGFTLKPDIRFTGTFENRHDDVLTVSVEHNNQVNYIQHVHISTIKSIDKFIRKAQRPESAKRGFRLGFLSGATVGCVLFTAGMKDYLDDMQVDDIILGNLLVGGIFGLAIGIVGSLIGYASPEDYWQLIWEAP